MCFAHVLSGILPTSRCRGTKDANQGAWVIGLRLTVIGSQLPVDGSQLSVDGSQLPVDGSRFAVYGYEALNKLVI